MAYYYTQTTNYYGEDNGATDVAYISDSYLNHIAYGFTDGNAYSNASRTWSIFTAEPRCVAVDLRRAVARRTATSRPSTRTSRST